MHVQMNIQMVAALVFPFACLLLAAFASAYFLFPEFVALLVPVMLVAQSK